MAAEIPGQRSVADACSKRSEVDGVAADLSGFIAAEVSGTSELTRLAGNGSVLFETVTATDPQQIFQ
ncbi:hypothetical protein [Bradyrhizobium sp. JYMT SZCCT0180]|uniref:hypothetical protein n=1 Tax=Bradyrhizobium sp. JYMT SZCCT0180 TaxID=2807666 RepID=UPI001BADA1FF|nr:hypothetical protein [Bradyrhizobium sp. JYMT SZCCT0180]MBR1212044.1 hypothetical protein [Bradyrhizobium sp. JYMT SZCCT0180]